MFSKYQKYRFKSVRMHQSTSLFSKKKSGIASARPSSHPLNEVKASAIFFIFFYLIAVSNIVSECVIMHAKATLFQNDLCSSKSLQIASEVTIYRLLFFFFHCSSKSFEIQSKCTISNISLKFQIVSNTVRMHHLSSLFLECSLHFKLFQWPSECTI